MPMRAQINTVPGQIYGRVNVGIAEYTAQRSINVTALTANEVDSDGYLIPGVVFSGATPGVLVGSTVPVFGCVIEPIKIAKSNSGTDLTAAGTVQVALLTIGQINRKIAEDNMGRAYNANELAGFLLAACHLILLF